MYIWSAFDRGPDVRSIEHGNFLLVTLKGVSQIYALISTLRNKRIETEKRREEKGLTISNSGRMKSTTLVSEL